MKLKTDSYGAKLGYTSLAIEINAIRNRQNFIIPVSNFRTIPIHDIKDFDAVIWKLFKFPDLGLQHIQISTYSIRNRKIEIVVWRLTSDMIG